MTRIGDMGPHELARLARREGLNEREALQILRNPNCSAEVAAFLAEQRRALSSHTVRELLAGFRGFSHARALNLLATLPWTSLLRLAKEPRTPPAIRRHAEAKILARLSQMTLGEKVALARIAHRPLFRPLFSSRDEAVLIALLDNPRLVENDIVVLVNTLDPPAALLKEILAHRRWGNYREIRVALAASRAVPEPLALSVLAVLGAADLSRVVVHRAASPAIRRAAKALQEKRKRSAKAMLRSSVDEPLGDSSDPSQSPG